DVSLLRKGDLQAGVIQVGRRAMLQERVHRLVDPSAHADHVSARTQGDPLEVDGGYHDVIPAETRRITPTAMNAGASIQIRPRWTSYAPWRSDQENLRSRPSPNSKPTVRMLRRADPRRAPV